MLNSVDIKKAINKKEIAYFTIHKTERTRGMVKKRNLKRFLAVVLSFAMAIQPTLMVFAEGENTGVETKSDVKIAITADDADGITVATPLDGKLGNAELVENLKARVKVTTSANGEEVSVEDEAQAKGSVGFNWKEDGTVTSLDGQIKEGSTYEVQAVLSGYSSYNDAQSEFVTVNFRDSGVVETKKTLRVTLESDVEYKLEKGGSYDLKELVKYVTAYDGTEETDVKDQVLPDLGFFINGVETQLLSEAGEYDVTVKYQGTEYSQESVTVEPESVKVTITEDKEETEKKKTFIQIESPVSDVYEGSEIEITAKVTALDGDGREEAVKVNENEIVYHWSRIDGDEKSPVESKPTAVGTYEVYAEYVGDDSYQSSVSNTLRITINKKAAKPITITLKENQKVEVGKINKADLVEKVTAYNGEAAQNMMLTGDALDAVIEKLIFTWTDSKGDTSTELPTVKGSYTVTAKYEGDEKYDASESKEVEVEVLEPTKDDPIEVKISANDIEKEYDGKAFVEADLNAKVTTDPKDVKLSYVWKDKDGKELETAPVNAGEYELGITPSEDKYTGSATVKAVITKRVVTVSAANVTISENSALPKEWEVSANGILTEEDWKTKPTAKCDVEDTARPGNYPIVVSAEVKDEVKDNYDLKLVNGELRITRTPVMEGDKVVVEFFLSDKDAPLTTDYNGEAFKVSEDAFTNYDGFDMKDAVLTWTKDGVSISQNEVADAGKYVLTVSVPETDEKFTGSDDFDVTINKRTVSVNVVPESDETNAGEMADYDLEVVNAVEGKFGWVQEPAVKVASGDVNKVGSYTLIAFGGDAGENYTLDYVESKEITVIGQRKPVILEADADLTVPKKGFIYTGEAIQPAAKVTYHYTDANNKAKKEKLKLNVDYTVTYVDNVNAGDATAIIRGIGGYAGYVTKTFTIAPKDIKKAVISPVGDVKYGEHPIVVVTDGIYELTEDIDYQRGYEGYPTADPAESATVTLKINAKEGGNYTGSVKKTVKFNVLNSNTKAESISGAQIEWKKEKTYKYNGKAQKPAVKVTLNGKTLKANKEYKVIYTNNVNAGTAGVRIVGVTKKGIGYYGTAQETKTFTINKKEFSKVKTSAITIPRVSALNGGVTLNVKDGKRVLVAGKDFNVENMEALIAAAQDSSQKKFNLTLTARNSNYDESQKTVTVKFANLNLASKTADVKISPLNGTAINKAEDVVVIYNGNVLTRANDKNATSGDYYVANVNTGKHTVKVTALKKSVFKGSRTFKDADLIK